MGNNFFEKDGQEELCYSLFSQPVCQTYQKEVVLSDIGGFKWGGGGGGEGGSKWTIMEFKAVFLHLFVHSI